MSCRDQSLSRVVHAWNKFHATGEETGETALLGSLFGIFRRGDLALFDPSCAGGFLLALLQGGALSG